MFTKLLKKIAIALDQKGIPYMVIGGQAVLLHGEPRMTRDIDITVGITTEQIDPNLRCHSGNSIKTPRRSPRFHNPDNGPSLPGSGKSHPC